MTPAPRRKATPLLATATSVLRSWARWRCVALFLVAGLAVSCDRQGNAHMDVASARQVFLVGPLPANTGGVDHRFLVSVPNDYVPGELRHPGPGASPVGRFVFYADARSFSPARHGPRADAHNLFIAFFWAPDDFVSKRVDGSWLNSFSQYNAAAASEHGLQARRPASPYSGHQRLFLALSPERHVMIECAYLPDVRPNLCQMTAKADGPVVEIWFDRALLPQWRQMARRSDALIDSWIASASGGSDR